MAKFEITWSIDIDLPEEIIQSKSRMQIKESLQRLIANGAVSEFNAQIEEWLDTHKGKEAQPVLLNPFEGVITDLSALEAISSSKADAQ